MLGVALLAVGAAACSDDGSAQPAAPPATADVRVEVDGAWTRPTPGGTDRNAVYAEFTSSVDDELVSASVDPAVADTVELHETKMQSMTADTATAMDMAPTTDMGADMASMTPSTAVALPAGDTVMFEPGGYHVMLVGLTAPLDEGDTFDMTFTFRDGGDVTAPIVVGDGPP